MDLNQERLKRIHRDFGETLDLLEVATTTIKHIREQLATGTDESMVQTMHADAERIAHKLSQAHRRVQTSRTTLRLLSARYDRQQEDDGFNYLA